MIADGYEILGVAKDATPKEMKRAYFRLIRQHTPEKDPEGFKRIHDAYESLLREENIGRPDFPKGTEEEELYIHQLQDYIDHKQFALARDMAEKILKKKPGQDHIRYLLGIAQRQTGNPIKSSNNFLKLLEKYPDDMWLEREACLSYYERGWKNKAYEQAVLAYSHGCCDIRFINIYLKTMDLYWDAFYDYNKAIEKLFQSSPKWNRDNFSEGISIFKAIKTADMDKERRLLFMRALDDFLGQLGNVLENYTDWLGKTMEGLFDYTRNYEQAVVAVSFANKAIAIGKKRYQETGYLYWYSEKLEKVLTNKKYPASFVKAVSRYNTFLYNGKLKAYGDLGEKAIEDRRTAILIACCGNRQSLIPSVEELKTLIPDIYRTNKKFFDALGNPEINARDLDHYL